MHGICNCRPSHSFLLAHGDDLNNAYLILYAFCICKTWGNNHSSFHHKRCKNCVLLSLCLSCHSLSPHIHSYTYTYRIERLFCSWSGIRLRSVEWTINMLLICWQCVCVCVCGAITTKWECEILFDVLLAWRLTFVASNSQHNKNRHFRTHLRRNNIYIYINIQKERKNTFLFHLIINLIADIYVLLRTDDKQLAVYGSGISGRFWDDDVFIINVYIHFWTCIACGDMA